MGYGGMSLQSVLAFEANFEFYDHRENTDNLIFIRLWQPCRLKGEGYSMSRSNEKKSISIYFKCFRDLCVMLTVHPRRKYVLISNAFPLFKLIVACICNVI